MSIKFDTTIPAAEWVDISELIAWDKNPRFNKHAVSEVAASISRFGFGSPIVAKRDTKRVIAGHTRLQAAFSLGLTKVPVRFLDISDDEANAMTLADNKLGELAYWDESKLSEVLNELQSNIINVDDLGFSDSELKYLMSPPLEIFTAREKTQGIRDSGKTTVKVTVLFFKQVEATDVIKKALRDAGIEAEVA